MSQWRRRHLGSSGRILREFSQMFHVTCQRRFHYPGARLSPPCDMSASVFAPRANKRCISVSHSSRREAEESPNIRGIHARSGSIPTIHGTRNRSGSLQASQSSSRPCNGSGSREVHRKMIPGHVDNKPSAVFPALRAQTRGIVKYLREERSPSGGFPCASTLAAKSKSIKTPCVGLQASTIKLPGLMSRRSTPIFLIDHGELGGCC